MQEFWRIKEIKTIVVFHCRKVNGDPEFEIDEWNKALEYCNNAGIEGEERDKILHPDKFPCKEQCFDCMADVGETRSNTQKLVDKLKNKEVTNNK